MTSGPAAPAGIARNNPKFAEEFDKLAKVAGGGADAPEPTFALGGLTKKKPSRITELVHEFKTVREAVAGDESDAQGAEQGNALGYKVTVTLPDNVTGLDDLDVEVSAHKVACLFL